MTFQPTEDSKRFCSAPNTNLLFFRWYCLSSHALASPKRFNQFSRLPFQVTLVLGCGGMPCFRTSYATLQSVLRHPCGVAVVVSDKPFTGQEVIGTQTHGVGFLAVCASAVRLLLLGFPALARHYRHDRGMDMRRVFVHVQHCRNGVR